MLGGPFGALGVAGPYCPGSIFEKQGAALEKFGTIILGIVPFVIIISVVLRGIDWLLDPDDRRKLVEKVGAFYVQTANLQFYKSFHQALSLQYKHSKVRRSRFLKLFCLLSILVFLLLSYGAITTPIANIAKLYKDQIGFDFDVRYSLFLVTSINDQTISRDDSGKICIIDDQFSNWIVSLNNLSGLCLKYSSYIANSLSNPVALKTSSVPSSAIMSLILALALLFALSLSFLVNQNILSAILRSHFHMIVVIIGSIIIAVSIPPLVVYLVIGGTVSLVAYLFGGILDYTYFDDVNILTVALATSSVVLVSQFAAFYLPALLTYYVRDLAVFMSILEAVFMFSMIEHQVHYFVIDTYRVLHLDINIGYIESIINWAIFTDLMYQ